MMQNVITAFKYFLCKELHTTYLSIPENIINVKLIKEQSNKRINEKKIMSMFRIFWQRFKLL